MQQPIVPSWFKGRQCKAEPAGDDHTLKLTGPNLGDAYISVRQADNRLWLAALRRAPDGADVAVTEPEIATEQDAWEAAFELYRTHVIV
jgi:hypothetical protein